MKLKKVLSVLMVSAMFLTGCASGNSGKQEEKKAEEEKSVKVVACSVAATNVLHELGADIIGIPTTQLDIPEDLKDLPQVGQAMAPDLEKVASLEPDVFVMDNSVEKSLKEYDFNTFFLKTNTYTDYIKSIEELGKEINKQEEAEKLISSLKESEKEVAKIKGDTDATVAILFGSGENFMLATETSYLGDLLKTVGGTNIATELDGSAKSPYLQFSLEQIVQTNPDYILRFAHGNLEETKAFDDAFDKNPAYAELDAVKNNKVIDLDSNIFNVSANLNVSEAIKTLGGILYGE